MAQFAFGLLAGIIVGLVMEWVIDWGGLFPRRTSDKTVTKSPAKVKVVSNDSRVQSPAAPAASSSNIDIESDEE